MLQSGNNRLRISQLKLQYDLDRREREREIGKSREGKERLINEGKSMS